MTDNADLWDVRELPGGLALELRAGNDPALVLAQGKDRVRVERAHVKGMVAALVGAAADLAEVLVSPWLWLRVVLAMWRRRDTWREPSQGSHVHLR